MRASTILTDVVTGLESMTRITVVGPTHPFKGGIARHTTEVALHLELAGHEVRMETWNHQYPARLYPGEQRVQGPAEGEEFGDVQRHLNWFNPFSWLLAGHRSRAGELLVVAMATPIQIPAYLLLIAVARPKDVAVICHNVLPHEPRFFDERLVKLLLGRATRVVAHTPAQVELATSLGAGQAVEAALAPHLPTDVVRRQESAPVHRRLLFFGLVRPYKGLRVLLRALARVPDVELSVVGELWEPEADLVAEIERLGLSGRVDLRPGYLTAEEIPEEFSRHDALVLPYLDGTASQNVLLAQQLGLPVIASNVGSFPSQLNAGVDGLIVEPGDDAALAAAISALYEGDTLAKMRAAVPAEQPGKAAWQAYIATLVGPGTKDGARE